MKTYTFNGKNYGFAGNDMLKEEFCQNGRNGKMIANVSEASVYVGTFAKYNSGSLAGGWLCMEDYADMGEFLKACRKLHEDEEDPEFMFQDWENFPKGMISNSGIAENFFILRDALESMDRDEQEAFYVWADAQHRDFNGDADDLMRDFRDEYVGRYDTEEDFTYEVVQEMDGLTEFAREYFDYKLFAHDLFMGDYWFEDGFVFRME